MKEVSGLTETLKVFFPMTYRVNCFAPMVKARIRLKEKI